MDTLHCILELGVSCIPKVNHLGAPYWIAPHSCFVQSGLCLALIADCQFYIGAQKMYAYINGGYRRPGFDSRHYQKKNIVGLERGALSLVSTN
jgi:hypothetical protein